MTCRWCGDQIQVRPDGHTWESADRMSARCPGTLGGHSPSKAPVVTSPFTDGARDGALPAKITR